MMKKVFSILSLVTVFLLGATNSFSMGAPGDDCANAVVIGSLPFQDLGQTNCGSFDYYSSASACASSYMNGEEYVYSYTPAADEDIDVSLTSDATWVGVFVTLGCPDVGSCVDMGTSSGSSASIAGATLLAGNTYYIIVSTYPAPDCINSFNLNVTSAGSPPPTSNCGTAEPVSSVPYSYTGTTCGAGDNYSSADACGSSYLNGEDFVFEYTPSANEAVSVDLTTNSSWVGVIVTEGCPDVGTCVGTATSSGASASGGPFGLTAGTTYYFTVSTYPTPDCIPNFTLDLFVAAPTCTDGVQNGDETGVDCGGASCPPCASNNVPCDAMPITVSSGVCSWNTYSNLSSTDSGEPSPGCSSYGGGDVWFSVVVPASGNLVLDSDVGGITDGGMAVYSGNCNNPTEIACDDDSSPNGLMPAMDLSGLTPGSTVWIRFWEYGGDVFGAFDLCVYEPGPPPNDDPCDATPISVAPLCSFTTYDNSYATNSGYNPGCAGWAGNDMWFSAIVPASGQISADSDVGTIIDGGMAIWNSPSNNCADLTLVSCDDNSSTNGTTMPQIDATGLTPGETVWIQFWEDGNNNNGTFDLCVTESSGPPSCLSTDPADDDCLAATPICDLEGYCGNTSASYTSGQVPAGFCGSVENNSWLSFVASATSATLYIWTYGCTYGDGIQMEIYGTNNCTSFTSYSNCWNPGIETDGSITATGLTPGQTYYLMIDGWAGDVCDYTISAGSGVFAATAISTETGTNVVTICAGESTQLEATGGTTYSWSPSGSLSASNISNPVASPTTTTTYTVTVSGGNPSCPATATASVTVNVTTGITPNPNQTNVTCNGGSNGTASVNPTDGTAPYTYAWSTGATTSGVSGLAAGSYTVTITDDTGCEAYETITITQPNPVVVTLSSTQANCGACDGTATITNITGGSGTYSSQNWSNSQSGMTATALCGGTAYTVTVTDNNGCTGTSSVTISNGGSISAGFSPVANSCLQAAFTYNFNNTGSTGAGTTFSWDFGDGIGTSTLEDPSYTYTTVGTYTITQVVTQGSCSAVSTQNVTIFPNVVTNISSSLDPLCAGNCNGSATAAVTVGSSPYSYNWAPNGYTGDGTVTYSALCDGTYTLTVTDANGCTGTTSVTLTEPAPMVLVASRTNVLCNGTCTGTANVTVTSGGTPSFSYAWSGGAGTAASVAALCAGTYTVTVTDGNGCTETASVVITQPATVVSVTASATNELCYGDCTGTLTASGSGGTAPYSYVWDDPSSTTGNGVNNVCSNTYNVTITDGNGCTATAATNVTAPTPMTVAISTTQLDCFGDCDGTATVDVQGGTPTYLYEWSDPLHQTTQTATGLCAGTYDVTVTDANGCTAPVPPPPVSSCFEITDILVNSCGGSQEGPNEMVTLQLGSSSLNTSDITITWPSNSWLGICANATTAATVAAINSTITAGGSLIEPPGGVIPAGAEVLIITSTAFNYSLFDFTNLDHDVYVIFQCPGNTAGHFANTDPQPADDRELTISFGAGCDDVVNYYPNALTNLDGESVSFTQDNNWATYNNGCVAPIMSTEEAVIAQPPAFTATISGNDVSCNNVCDGNATVVPTGGTPPYTYIWNNPAPAQLTPSATALCDGTYTVTVTDVNLCTVTQTITILENPAVTASIASTNVSCNAACNGTATVTPGGGTGTYSYNWSNAQTTAAITGLCAGTFTVTVTDSDGCTASATVTITQPPLLTANIATSVNVTCNGLCNGSATVTPGGGTGAGTYSFLWNDPAPAQTTAAATALCAGTYTVTITDANGCTATDDIVILENPAVTATISGTTNVTCNGLCNGNATVTPGGGTGVYTYLWDDPAPVQTTPTATALCAGTYNVTVTDANGCSATTNATINENPPVTATITAFTDVTCNGLCNGSATVSAAGGTTTYTYLWNDPAPAQTTVTSTALCAGTYTVTVTDGAGCTATASQVISQPTLLTASATTTNSTCGASNGTATVTASNGTSGYTYLWSDGQTTATATTYAAGTYTVTVTDANGCTVSTTANVVDMGSPTASVTIDANVSCNGVCDGEATVIPAGGTTPYTINWDDPGTQSTTTATGLCAGAINVTVTDANGCSANASGTITQPTVLTVTTSSTNVTCNGGTNGTVSVTPSGGTTPYTYSWDNGAGTLASASGLAANTYNVTVTDSEGCTATGSATVTQNPAVTATITASTDVTCNGGCNGTATVTAGGGNLSYTYLWDNATFQTTENATGLCATTYNVTVTDGLGCTATTSVTINENPAVTATLASSTNVSCNGLCDGTATVTAGGGDLSYSYLWSDPGAQTNAAATGLCAGTFTVTVSDGLGCTATTSATITQPTVLTANISTSTNITCNGGCNGSATVGVSGGTGAGTYTYLWNDPGTQTTAAATGLCAGAYTVTVSDGNGCTATATVTLTENPPVTASISASSDASCNGVCDGTMTVTPGGGNLTFTYLWNDPAPAQTTVTATALCAGTYTVTVSDGAGCTATASGTISENPPVTALISGTTDITCNGLCNGDATVTADGGDLSYTYLWSDPGAQTTATASGLCAGGFTVTISDGAGCTATATTTINQNPLVTAAISASTPPSCNGVCNASATVTPGGGDLSFTYLWNDPGSQTTATATGLCAGTFTVTVTDGEGCTAIATVNINENTLVTASISASTNVSCSGLCNGTATVLGGGGTGSYTYIWDDPLPAQTTITATALCAGTYNVTVTDGAGCTATTNVTIVENPPVTALIASTTDVSCNGLCNGDATVTPGGGNGTYSYQWDDGLFQTTVSATGLCAGTYNVTVSDGAGCTATTSATINQNPLVTATISASTDVSCNGAADGSATVAAGGGDLSYSYLWSDPGAQTTATATGLSGGTYNVTVTDGEGCTATASVTISENPAVTAAISASTDVACNSGSNGSATVNPGGGDGTYSYQWDDAGSQTTQTATGLTAGTYNVTVTDGDGCTATTSVVINENPPVSVVMTGNDATCNTLCNGDATATPSGGNGSFTFAWDDPGFSATGTISTLCVGTYNVTVTDGNGCSVVDSYAIAEPAAITFTTSSTQANCGIADGTATATAGGGAGGFTYDWVGTPAGDGTDNITGVLGGSYDVTVTDANLCTAVTTVNVSESGAPVAAITGQVNVSCNGLSNGEATVTLTTPTVADYEYAWSTGNTYMSSSTSNTETGLAAGTYNVTITDNGGTGCATNASVTITQNPALAGSITSTVHVTCNGLCNGSATVSANGGTGAGTFSFEWSDPSSQATAAATGLCAGSYTVTVTDGNGCTITRNVTINENPAVTAVISASTDVTCNGLCNGSATVLPGGGTLTYTYLWDDPAPAQTTVTATALCAGNYNVTVTDGNGCTATTPVTINENPLVTASISASNNISCNGLCDGDLTVTAGGGDLSYTYLWNDPGTQTTDIATGLCAGTFSVTVSDGAGCTATTSATLTQNPALNALITGTVHVSCNGACDGQSTISANGGTGAGTYIYQWDDPGTQTTATATGLCAGTFNVTVTDANGCSVIRSVTINENPAVTATLTGTTDVICNGQCNGTATIVAGGGDLSYTYNWDDPGTQSTAAATGLCAGSYNVTVTDGDGCTATTSATINENPAVTATITGSTDVSVFGACDGTATVLAGGGDASYSYLWSDPGAQSTDIATGLCSGTYTVTITDGNGCTATASVTINEPGALIITINTITDVTCFGDCNGDADISVNGGVQPYNLLWDDPSAQTDSTITGLCAGVYTVTVSDFNGATNTASVTISENPAVSASISASNDASCFGNCDADAIVTAGGGNGSYTYQWDDPGAQTIDAATGLCAGTFNVTVTDGNLCTATTSVVINEPAQLAVATTPTPALCNTACNGEIATTVSGGTAPYSYLWDDPAVQITDAATSLCAGAYGVTVTDANGCTIATGDAVTQPSAVTATTTSTAVSVFGLCDGTATVTPAGGTAPYSYLWNDPGTQTTDIATGLCAGPYSVTVSDANGCTVVATVTVTQPGALNVSITAFTNLVCNGVCTGSATVSVSGGVSPYFYLWSDAGAQTTATASSLCAGTYTVTVSDNNGATNTTTVTLTEPSLLTTSVTGTDALCNGSCNGTATVAPAGGTSPYSYGWDDPGTQSTATASNLCAGTYNVTVTDANLCTSANSYMIAEPAALTSGTTMVPALCNTSCDGSITLIPTGGTSPYSFLWNDPAPAQTTVDATGLCAGTYTATITDANGCTLTVTETVTEPAAISATTAATAISINGLCDGTATITPSGGTSPYGYEWSDPATQTTATATGLCAQSYTVTVTDANGCTYIATIVVPDVDALLVNITAQTNLLCNSVCTGTATATVSGGIPPYNYLWDDPASQTTDIATGLCAGTFNITVTDANGATANTSVLITEPALLTSAISSTPASCNGSCNGTATVVPSGGVTPYSYLWDDPGTQAVPAASGLCAGAYNVTVTDNNLCTTVNTVSVSEPTALAVSLVPFDVTCAGFCNGYIDADVSGGTAPYSLEWSDPLSQSTDTAYALCAGTYTLTATDANGCTLTGNSTISEPSLLTGTISSTPVSIFGICDGTATVVPSGGTSPYTYVWSDAGAQTTDIATGLCAGTYNVTITDANGCTLILNVDVLEPGALNVSLVSQINIACTGVCIGEAVVTVSGGVTPYDLLWDDPSAQTDSTITGLCAGTYIVTVTDDNGATATTSVIITEPDLLTTEMSVINVSCNAACDGSASVSADGGVFPYTYVWDDPLTQSTSMASNLCDGNYSATVTDANGCTAIHDTVITQPVVLTSSISGADVLCNGGNSGSIDVTVTGGTLPYSYLWSNSATTEDISGVIAGTYTTTITDGNGCTTTNSITINQPSPLSAVTSTTDANCNQTDGSATVVASGGTGSYTYAWNDPASQTTATASGLGASGYTVIITDGNLCTISAIATVINLDGVSASITGSANITCNADCDGFIVSLATGGTGPYSYLWNDGAAQTTSTASALCAGTYTVTITDANNCTSTASQSLTEPAQLVANIPAWNNVTCFGTNNGDAAVTVTGGTTPYTYVWNGGSNPTSDHVMNLVAGVFTVTVTDDHGCTATASVTITQPSVLSLSTSFVNENCGQSNGSATVTPSGGTVAGDYHYAWDGGLNPSLATISNIGQGTYNVTVSDDNGCSATTSVTITNISAGTATISSYQDVSCAGVCDGTATVSYGGGPSPLTYSWNTSPVQTTATATGLCGGNYTVSVTDGNGCTVNTTVTINQPAAMALGFNKADPVCNGNSDGIVMAVPSGGTSPYTYMWNILQTTQSVNGLPSGTYTVTVTDNHGCTISGDTVLLDPDPIVLYIDTLNANCGQNDGAIDLFVDNAAAPVTYSWTGPAGYTSTNEDITNLFAGNYCVTVIDVKGCQENACWNVNDATGPNATILAGSTQHVLCNGECTGSATVAVSGGTTPYTYLWSDPLAQFTPTANNLCAGAVSVAVTDSNGCVATADLTITQPQALNILITKTDPLCYQACNGSATVLVNGGTTPYSYLWSSVNQTNATATNLCEDTYTVFVTDANDCVISGDVEIFDPPFISITTDVINTTCSADCNGQITANVSGGTGAYQYSWSDANNQNTITASGLCSGTYTVTVTDQNLCTETTYALITSPDPVVASITNYGDVSCFNACDGYMQADVYGGTVPYTYAWPGGGTASGQNNVCAGSYIVTITDAQGCVDTALVTIDQPSQLNATVVVDDETCYNYCDGKLQAVVNGGTQPYTYLWSTLQSSSIISNLCDGTYTLTVTDVHNCVQSITEVVYGPPLLGADVASSDSAHCQQSDGSVTMSVFGGTPGYTYYWENSAGQTVGNNSIIIVNVPSGPYYFTVTDVNGCDATDVAIVHDISGPVIDSIVSTTVSCFGDNDGTATVYISGGTPPYIYIWNDPGFQSMPTATNLYGGNYTVQVFDDVMCQNSDFVNVPQPNILLTAVINHSDAYCPGACDGTATVQVAPNAGTQPYSFVWSDPAAQTSQLATGLCAGTFTVTTTDAHGCVDTAIVNIDQPTPLSVMGIVNDVSCYGGNNGSINLYVTGGSPVYNYTWVTPPASGNNPVAAYLPANTYEVVVSDAHNCGTNEFYTVNEPAPISLTYQTTQAYCDANNGTATVTPSGGTGSYSYLWTPGSDTTAFVSNKAPGVHQVTVTDGNGCSEIFSIQIFAIPPPELMSVTTTDASCFGGSDGSALVQVEYGTEPYEYHWPASVAGINDSVATNLESGTYQITVYDGNNCPLYDIAFYIDEPAPVGISLNGAATICMGNTVEIAANGSGGTPPYTYSWTGPGVSGGDQFQYVSPTESSSYFVSAIDANGCLSTGQDSVTINVYPGLALMLSAQDSMVCEDDGTMLTAAVSGGNGGPYYYYWDGILGTSQLAVYPAATNIYTVTVSDGCSPNVVDSIVVGVSPKPPINIVASVNSGCEPLSVTFQNAGDVLGVAWQWEFGDMGSAFNDSEESNPTHLYEEDGFYDVSLTVSSAYGCTNEYYSDNMITVYPSPVAEFAYTPENPEAFDATVQFYDLSTNAAFWIWDFGDGYNNVPGQYPIHTYQQADTFRIHLDVWSEHGCYDSTSLPLIVKPVHTFYAPTAFTPNLGGSDTERNPYWTPEATGVDDCPECYKLWVYDRWGEIIFYTDEFYGNNPNDENRWNGRFFNKGRICQIGVYTWYCVLQDVNGNQHDYVGTVTVIR